MIAEPLPRPGMTLLSIVKPGSEGGVVIQLHVKLHELLVHVSETVPDLARAKGWPPNEEWED